MGGVLRIPPAVEVDASGATLRPDNRRSVFFEQAADFEKRAANVPAVFDHFT